MKFDLEQPTIEWCLGHIKSLQCIRYYWPKFFEKIQDMPGTSNAEKLWRYFYGEPKVCPICGGDPKFINFTRGFHTYCSQKCRYIGTKSTVKQTCLERYGVENPSQCDKIKKKKIKTTLSHYGVEHPTQNQTIKEKVKQTCLERYGVENPFQSKSIKEKIKQTNIERYGTDHPMRSKIIQEKIKQTCLERYGARNFFCSNIFMETIEYKEKSRQTCLERYGVEHPTQNQIIKEKSRQTCLERYGVEHPMRLKIIQEKDKQTCLERYGVPHGFMLPGDNYSIISQEYFKTLDQQYPHARYATKGGEHRVGPYLLDWYDPDSNTCIEFNGDYWHANPKLYDRNWVQPTTNKSSEEIWNHDLKKMKYLMEQGIDVKVVWESEIKITDKQWQHNLN